MWIVGYMLSPEMTNASATWVRTWKAALTDSGTDIKARSTYTYQRL